MSTKEAIKQQQTNGPALATYALDPFEAYANAVAPRTIIGTLLRFSKGDYLAGEEGKEIPNGSTFTANLDELLAGWIKWSGGRPIEHMMVRVAEGRTLPKREVLGDSDASHWEADSAGVPRDPWQFTNYLPLLDEQGGIFTFATSSRGGLTAIGDLACPTIRTAPTRRSSRCAPNDRARCWLVPASEPRIRAHQVPAVYADGLGVKNCLQRSLGRCRVYTRSRTACASRRSAGGTNER